MLTCGIFICTMCLYKVQSLSMASKSVRWNFITTISTCTKKYNLPLLIYLRVNYILSCSLIRLVVCDSDSVILLDLFTYCFFINVYLAICFHLCGGEFLLAFMWMLFVVFSADLPLPYIVIFVSANEPQKKNCFADFACFEWCAFSFYIIQSSYYYYYY